ncbi:MAG: tetratricopeptide repeat protein [Bryobacteraceae bacterium]
MLIRFSWILLMLAFAAWGALPETERARRLYDSTEYRQSIVILQALPEKNAAAYELLGKGYYRIGDYKEATEAFEKAIAADPRNSVYHNWLGKAYGRRAETSSVFTAARYASRARKAFEQAVQLDPSNKEALNDLFEYYLQAPGFMGGGFDKAAAMATRIAALDPAEGHYVQARMAEKRKEFGKAEQHLRRAAELAPRQVGRVVDLARFLASQGRFDESEQAFRKAEKIEPDNPKLLFERASTYIRAGRNLDTARDLLGRYLESDLTPDDPPRGEAERLLKQVSGSS